MIDVGSVDRVLITCFDCRDQYLLDAGEARNCPCGRSVTFRDGGISYTQATTSKKTSGFSVMTPDDMTR